MSSLLRRLPGLPAGAGVTFHPALAARLLRAPPAFLEFVAESLTSSSSIREARAFGELCPIALHGTGLSLGSADGVDAGGGKGRVSRLARLVRETGAVACSEHLSFVRAGGVEIGHLTPLPACSIAVDVIADNVARAQQKIPGLWLENIWSPLPPHRLPDEMDEPALLHAVVAAVTARTGGCGLLLDVANLHANCQNRGLDALALVERLPLFAVRELHVAGSRTDPDGFVVDTHADAVSEAVFALTAAVLARTGPLPVCLERDRDLDTEDDVDQVMTELARLQALVDAAPRAPSPALAPDGAATAAEGSAPAENEGRERSETKESGGGPRSTAGRSPGGGSASDRPEVQRLRAWQHTLARALTDDAGADDADLRRARGILARKHAERRRPSPNSTSASTKKKKPFPFSLWSPP